MKKRYFNIRGTSDFGPSETLSVCRVHQKARQIFKTFGYREIILPLLEEQDLFVKGVGRATDIVDRQMFKIEGKNIVLRPEGTAQVIRYYLQNSLNKQSDFHKFFYTGAMFRGERPQKGRLRQFHHLGVEAIGSASVYLDAEMINLSFKILDSVGIKEKKLLMNSLGCKNDKNKFSRLLKESLSVHKKYLCQDCRQRLDKNPLRVLDCKKQECRKYFEGPTAAKIDLKRYLCKECSNHYTDLHSLLKDLSIEVEDDPYLVRGLDYYTNTVFEIISPRLGAQNAIGAGGRYNNLIEFLGGPDIPAVGFALGVERMLLVLEQKPKVSALDIFVAVASKDLLRAAFKILEDLRKEGFSCDYDYCQRSLRGQLRFAQKSQAKHVIIVGDHEYRQGCVFLKDMQRGSQEKVRIKDLLSFVNKTPRINYA